MYLGRSVHTDSAGATAGIVLAARDILRIEPGIEHETVFPVQERPRLVIENFFHACFISRFQSVRKWITSFHELGRCPRETGFNLFEPYELHAIGNLVVQAEKRFLGHSPAMVVGLGHECLEISVGQFEETFVVPSPPSYVRFPKVIVKREFQRVWMSNDHQDLREVVECPVVVLPQENQSLFQRDVAVDLRDRDDTSSLKSFLFPPGVLVAIEDRWSQGVQQVLGTTRSAGFPDMDEYYVVVEYHAICLLTTTGYKIFKRAVYVIARRIGGALLQ